MNKGDPNTEAAPGLPATVKRANAFIRKLPRAGMYLETELRSPEEMERTQRLNRRWFLWTDLVFSAPRAASARVKSETVYHFATRECDVRMSVEFYDRYSSKGFWFDERQTDRRYCFSADGQEGHNCLTKFSGSIAIAQYHVRARSRSPNLLVLRERVRTIDRDSRLNDRPPYERTLRLEGGVASDIQAFGYEQDTSGSGNAGGPEPHEPWCLFRQDLYLDGAQAPFLVVHWKHMLSAIRILDVIPGDETQVIGNGKKEETG